LAPPREVWPSHQGAACAGAGNFPEVLWRDTLAQLLLRLQDTQALHELVRDSNGRVPQVEGSATRSSTDAAESTAPPAWQAGNEQERETFISSFHKGPGVPVCRNWQPSQHLPSEIGTRTHLAPEKTTERFGAEANTCAERAQFQQAFRECGFRNCHAYEEPASTAAAAAAAAAAASAATSPAPAATAAAAAAAASASAAESRAVQGFWKLIKPARQLRCKQKQ